MPGPLTFEFRFARPNEETAPRRTQEDPLRMLVLGDFRGGSRNGDRPNLKDRPVLQVDIDSYDRALARLRPRVTLFRDDPAATEDIVITELDDFHPETLYRKLRVFQDLRDLRGRLLDPADFEAAAAELARAAGAPEVESTAVDQDEPAEDESALFGRLLGDRPAAPQQARPLGDPAGLIARLVEPEIERGADPERQRLLVATVDDAIARRMRAALRDPDFKALESAWRGLWWLVSRLETGEALELHVADVSRAELAADIDAAGDDLEASGLYQALVERGLGTPGGQPWSLVAGLYDFGTAPQDMGLLAALGAIASRAGGAFLAAADPALLGCHSLAETPDTSEWQTLDPEASTRWQALRRSSVAAHIGLALPRVLLRLPYGTRGDPVDAFAFEELPGGLDHEALLWGSPALASALLIGLAFQERGWGFAPGDLLDLDDLPAYTTSEDGEAQLTPCAEAFLSHRTADAILDRGIMPLLSHRNLNAVRLARFQSIADPPAALSGPWGCKVRPASIRRSPGGDMGRVSRDAEVEGQRPVALTA